jgi:GNAT superfamily N-acetyltransferase
VSEPLVRRVGAEEWQVLRDVRLAALAESPEAFGSTLAGERAFAEADWRRRIANRFTVLAWLGDDPVGIAGGYVDEDGSAELVSMWVAPSGRGCGAADALIAEVRAWATGTGGEELRLWVVEGNERAERVYARHGFVRTGRTQPVRDGEPAQEIEMVLRLRW